MLTQIVKELSSVVQDNEKQSQALSAMQQIMHAEEQDNSNKNSDETVNQEHDSNEVEII